MSDEAVQPGEVVLHQRRRSHFSERPAGRNGDAGFARAGTVPEHSRAGPRRILNKLEEVLVVTKVEEKDVAPRRRSPVAGGGHSGTAVAVGAREARRRHEAKGRGRCFGDSAQASREQRSAGPASGAAPKPKAPENGIPGAATNPASAKPVTVPAKTGVTPPSALKPATEQKPVPPPVKISDSNTTVKPKPAPPAGATQAPTSPDGPQ